MLRKPPMQRLQEASVIQTIPQISTSQGVRFSKLSLQMKRLLCSLNCTSSHQGDATWNQNSSDSEARVPTQSPGTCAAPKARLQGPRWVVSSSPFPFSVPLELRSPKPLLPTSSVLSVFGPAQFSWSPALSTEAYFPPSHLSSRV